MLQSSIAAARRTVGDSSCAGHRGGNRFASELNGPDRPNPVSHFGGILFVHVEKVGHHRLHNRLATVIRLHGDDSAEDLEQSTIPVFEDVVMRRDTGSNERAQVLADGLASVPVSNTEGCNGIIGKAIESLTES